MQKEIWKDIPGYEGIYQASTFGKIKSVKRKIFRKLSLSSNGYLQVILFKNNTKKTRTVHSIVCETFKNHKPNGHKLVINHKDFNKLNNHLDNFEIVTHRVNSNKKHLTGSSKYTGVSWHKRDKKWCAKIEINGKQIHLGYFKSEFKAHLTYKEVLNPMRE